MVRTGSGSSLSDTCWVTFVLQWFDLVELGHHRRSPRALHFLKLGLLLLKLNVTGRSCTAAKEIIISRHISMTWLLRILPHLLLMIIHCKKNSQKSKGYLIGCCRCISRYLTVWTQVHWPSWSLHWPATMLASTGSGCPGSLGQGKFARSFIADIQYCHFLQCSHYPLYHLGGFRG